MLAPSSDIFDWSIEILKSRIQTLESRPCIRCPNQDPNDQEMDGIDHFAHEQEYVCENSDDSCNRVCTKLYDCCFDENCKNEDKFIFDDCPNCKCSECILETSSLSEEKEHKGKDLTTFLGIRNWRNSLSVLASKIQKLRKTRSSSLNHNR